MVAAAFGTQTAGSVIRPAAFCGVVGFKPTFGAIDRTGLNVVSPSLDTLGVFARDVQDVALVFDAVRARSTVNARRPRAATARPRLGLVRTADWEMAEPRTRRDIDALAEALTLAGIDVVETQLPERFEELGTAQVAVMEREVSGALLPQLRQHPDLLSASTRELIERGVGQPRGQYESAQELAAACRARLPELFAGVDAVLTLAVRGEAPPIATTGDPVFCRAWTLLHVPAVSLPLLSGPTGLPVGVQLVGRPGEDDALLDVAVEVMRAAPRRLT
jgi:Asp-tRNA(Asn)/Glu-tRNA(Gln) amidotransferase A subunit family amidase